MDEKGKPAGVIAIVVETTERVLAERRNREEFQRLQNLFSQAPTFMAMVSARTTASISSIRNIRN